MPRFIVPVSTRTTKFTVAPVTVVVFATSDGRLVRLGSGLKMTGAGPRPPPRAPRPAAPCAGAAAGAGAGAVSVVRYTYCTTVRAEQFASIAGPSLVPSGRVNASVWQMNG